MNIFVNDDGVLSMFDGSGIVPFSDMADDGKANGTDVSLGSLDPHARFGIVSSLTLDQSAALQACADWVAANNFDGTIYWPRGDICHSAVIDWTGGALHAPYFSLVPDRISYPKHQGAGPGATRIRYTGPISNSDSWRFHQSATQVSAGIIRNVNLRMQHMEFHGPGIAVQATTLSAAVAPSAQTLSLTNAIAVVGDVIQCRETTTDTVMWLPVLEVSGAGPQVVTFANADARRRLPASAFNGFSSGGKVLVFKQGRAIKVGSISAAQSCIGQSIQLDGCRFYNWFGGVALDDVTNFKGDGNEFAGCMFGFEHGYNVDTFTLVNPFLGSDQPDFAFSAVNGSPVLTVGSLGMKVGSTLNEPGAARNIHKHSVVLSVVGLTVTLSDPYVGTTGSGKSGRVHHGTLVAAGPFRAAFQSSYVSQDNVGGTNTLLVNPVGGRIKQLVDWGDNVASGLVLQNPYIEVAQQMVTMGYPGATGNGQIKVIGGKIEGCESLTGPAFEDIRGVNFFDIDGLRGGGTAHYPLVGSSSYFSAVRLGMGWTWTNDQNGGAAVTLGAYSVPKGNEGQIFEYNTGFGEASGYGKMGGCRMSHVSTAMSGSINMNVMGVSQHNISVNAAGTLNIVDGGSGGHEVTFVLQATGAFIVTFGSNMYDATGAVIGALPVSINGTGMILVFRAQSGGNKWRLVSGENTGWA